MNLAIILAAGKGERLGAPKQYLPLTGNTILEHSFETFNSHPNIDKIIIMTHSEHKQEFESIPLTSNKLHGVYIGGASRQESVYKGLIAIKSLNPKNVLIHDAARPFVSHEHISKLIQALDQHDAADLYIDVVDTLKDKSSFDTVNRDQYYITQTPQAFNYSKILNSHERHKGANYTDDITLAKLDDLSITLVKGDKSNFKITTQDDYIMATKLCTETRVGTGFDTHKLEEIENGYITLGGEQIPANYKVIAHSDGDVILHALMDAMLGTIGLGDIGEHFPPSDNKWKGASSLDMLQIVFEILCAHHAEIVNIDITYLGEVPKILKYKDKMKNNIASILKLDNNRINIKATTAEGLGFVGRVEGVAALSSCSVKLMK